MSLKDIRERRASIDRINKAAGVEVDYLRDDCDIAELLALVDQIIADIRAFGCPYPADGEPVECAGKCNDDEDCGCEIGNLLSKLED